MIPVMKMRMGATRAESTPPAPNSDQKMGSWDRFMSHPAHDDVDENGSGDRRQPAANGYDGFGQRVAADTNVGSGLGRHLPPCVGVIADSQQREPVKDDGPRAHKRRAPRLIGGLALREPQQAHQQDDRVNRQENAARFADHVAREERVSAPPSLHRADVGPDGSRHYLPPLGMRSLSTPK